MQSYTLREIQSLLGLSPSVVRSLVAAGFVAPGRGPRNEYRFSFQDVVLLRTAYSLQRAAIPPRRILRSLKRLKASLPGELPLAGLRITAIGNEIAVKDGDTHRHVDSGQLLLDFEVRPLQGSVSFLTRQPEAAAEEPAADEAAQCFERGAALEGKDPAAAEAAYRRAIEKAPGYVDPYLNLGCMLCEAGRRDEAVALYHAALRHAPDEPLLHFNLGIALDDLGRTEQALACYEAAIALAPELADAHYNAARLYELTGRSSKAIRHYGEYKRLQRS
jgi:tetratricopeptide (TPR) repeat protein